MLKSSYRNGIEIRSAISACLENFRNFSSGYSHEYERCAEWIFEHLMFAEANDGTATRLFDKIQADMRLEKGRHGSLKAFSALGHLLRHDVFGCNQNLHDILSAAVIEWAPSLARLRTSCGVDLLRGLGGKGTPNSAAVNAVVKYTKDLKQLERKYLEPDQVGPRVSADMKVAAILQRMVKPVRKPMSVPLGCGCEVLEIPNVVSNGARSREVTMPSFWSGRMPIHGPPRRVSWLK